VSQATSELQDLYRELILDHSRNPRHFGRLDDATHSAAGINPLCGDKLRLYLCVDGDNNIESTHFEGSGCAISMASASLMADAMTNVPVSEAEACIAEITGRLTTDNPERAISTRLSKLATLDGVREFPGRVKCATLAWHTLHAALNNDTIPATTE
jgi:nitrogen fixation NifU-like protein